MAEPEHYRLFVAVEIPDGVKDGIHEVQEELRRVVRSPQVRWTRREQYHLTLRFLGNVESARLTELQRDLAAACRGVGALQLWVEGLGFFPDARRPRVAWLGLSDSRDLLRQLQRRVQWATAGFAAGLAEAPFTAHVTLARLNGVSRGEAGALGEVAARLARRSLGQWTTDRIQVMRSELSSHGARHSCLESIPLGEVPPAAR